MTRKFKMFALTGLIFFLSALHISFLLFPDFSEFYTLRIAPFFRVPLSAVSGIFPFSLFESLVIIYSLFVIFALLSGIKLLLAKLIKKTAKSYFFVYLRVIFSASIAAIALFVLSFDSSYSRPPLSKTLSLDEVVISEDSVAEALSIALSEISSLEDEIDYTIENGSSNRLSFKALAQEMKKAATKAADKYGYLQPLPFSPKPLAFSTPFAYTGISGVYGYFTGEANINTAFAEYSIPFTMAHELSHQLGVGSEREAEFSALLICLESDLPYIRYSAWSQVAVTLTNLLFEYNEMRGWEAMISFPDFALCDIYLSAKAYAEYSSTAADEIASAVNDVYLSANGDEGVISYSKSAELYVRYLLNHYKK